MPEFIPEHTPSGLDNFTRGYMEAMEWLLPEEIEGKALNRDKIRGFTRKAIKEAKAACEAFQFEADAALDQYEAISGRDRASAGHDFYLSRNGHGAGFFDRGNEPVFDTLQEAARAYGSTNEDVYRGWIYST